MIAWWWLLIACPVSAFLGSWFTGGRWLRAWTAREAAFQQIVQREPHPPSSQ